MGVLLLISGHSLGGCLGMLAAYDLACTKGCIARCVTFGSPRLGDDEFKQSFIQFVPRIARFVNKFDPVPRMPPAVTDPVNNDAELIHKVVAHMVRIPQSVGFNATGCRHVCPCAQLDDGLKSSAAHWTAVALK